MTALTATDPLPPPDRVLVRPMRAGDQARVGALTLAGYDRYGRIEGPYREYLADPARRLSDCTAVLVAELDGEVVGTVSFVLPGDAGWEGRAEPEGDAGFRVLAVAPEAEGHGVGRRLVTACIDLARQHGRRRIVIVTMAWMDRAQRMYTQLGFRRRPDLDVHFPGGLGYVLTFDLTPDAAAWFPPPGPTPDPVPWYEDVWSR